MRLTPATGTPRRRRAAKNTQRYCVAFALLGVEAASIECERPFAAKPSKNHHDVERFAELISTEVLDMLKRARSREGGALPAAPAAAPTAPATLTKAKSEPAKLHKSRTLYGLTKG